jgi:hypothetical protein
VDAAKSHTASIKPNNVLLNPVWGTSWQYLIARYVKYTGARTYKPKAISFFKKLLEEKDVETTKQKGKRSTFRPDDGFAHGSYDTRMADWRLWRLRWLIAQQI